MAKTNHRTTRRGTQKQRWRTHDEFLRANYPRIWQQKIDAELAGYRMSLQAEASRG